MARKKTSRLSKRDYIEVLKNKVDILHHWLERLATTARPLIEDLPVGEVRSRAAFDLVMAESALERCAPEVLTISNPEVEEPVFEQDIPSKRWANEKLREAKEGGRNRWGVPRSFGPVTGTFSQPLWLPTSLLAPLRGERGEQDAPRKASLEYIMRNWDAVRLRPVYIEVDPFGQPWVSDGNHRIMAAADMEEPIVLAEIKYFSGSQLRVPDEWKPGQLLRYHDESLLGLMQE